MELVGRDDLVRIPRTIYFFPCLPELGEAVEAFFADVFQREISVNRHKAFATRAEYIAGIEGADLVKLASLIRVVGLLMQVKAYLFWQK